MSKESENISSSMYNIYSRLMKEKNEKKRLKLEKKLAKKEKKKTKEEKEEEYRNNLDKWEESLYNLTGDDLEYSKKPSKKKKYTKWIGEEDGQTNLIKKPKKKKKISHKKAFEKDIEIAQAFLSDQNKLNADLEKRFKLIAGPADKNAMPMNKTTVDLLSVIMSGRANSLSMIKEIGNLKRISADLDLKQQAFDAKKYGDSESSDENISLSGSDMMASIFRSSTGYNNQSQQSNLNIDNIPSINTTNWEGPELESNYVKYENVPHSVIVERKADTGDMRFKAIRNDTGEEIPDYPLPTADISKLEINEDNKVVKGKFDELYQLRDV